MFTPRFYQDDCLRLIHRARRTGKKTALAVMASGLGKTVTMALDAERFRRDCERARVLYLCHQNHILHQARGTFEAQHGSKFSYGFYNGIEKSAHKADFLFASFATMRKHLACFQQDEFDYVVVDESHHVWAETFLDVVTYWKPKFLLGMTATPDRTDGQDIRKVFGKEVFYLPLEDALAQELLTPVDYRLMTDEIDIKKLLHGPDRRLSISGLNRSIFVPKRDEEIARVIRRHSAEISNPRSIIFCQSIAYCEHLSKFVKNCIPLHSHVPIEERVVRVELFRQGVIPTLLAVDVFNEGIDVPHANVLVFLRLTTSPVVFFQQLGRGLRLSEGKDKVVVLDFVGNCERVKTVYDLWSQIKARREKFLAQPKIREGNVVHGKRKNIEPFQLNVNHAQFQEKVLRIVDVVRRVNDGYSREECVKKLQEFAGKIGRSPTQKEVHRNKDLPSMSAYLNHFGSYTEALKTAGFVVNQLPRNLEETELLDQLRKLQAELGHPPSQREVALASTQGKCSSEPVFRNKFGSLSNALKKIGSNPSRYVGLNKKELCDQLRKLRRKLKRVPTVSDLAEAASRDETASYSVFRKQFKTWNNALRKAVLTKKKKEYPRYLVEDLVGALQKAARILGHVPTGQDVLNLSRKGKLKVGSLMPFYTRFKTFRKALEAAGLKPEE